MKNEHIDLLKDAALLLEEDHLNVARKLMKWAHEERPNGPFIKKKLDEYSLELNLTDNELKVKYMLKIGEVAIIPAGFRCHTKQWLFQKLNFKQATFPFDNGFFPPQSIANILEKRTIELIYPDTTGSHTVCIKQEHYDDERLGRGIKFSSSSYSEIDDIVTNSGMRNINHYLDSTLSYYTLDFQNNYVLAHYNWHKFATKAKSAGEYDKGKNIQHINNTMNKRIDRMFELCHSAKYVFFVFGEFQDYEYMMFDDEVFDLRDLSSMRDATTKAFGDKCQVVSFPEINSADKLLQLIDNL